MKKSSAAYLNGLEFNRALYNGFVDISTNEDVETLAYVGGDADEAVNKLSQAQESQWELQLYTKVGMGDGRQASNPWLQELPY